MRKRRNRGGHVGREFASCNNFLVLLEKDSSHGGSAFPHTWVESPCSVHQNDNLAVSGNRLVSLLIGIRRCLCLRHWRARSKKSNRQALPAIRLLHISLVLRRKKFRNCHKS